MKHVAIAGATDGIGLALALEYARRGWRVGLLGRDPEKLAAAVAAARAQSPGETVLGVRWDATEAAAAARALAEVTRGLGQVDLLVYNAGLLIRADDAAGRAAAAERMMEVNVIGAIRLLEHAAEYMVAAGRGRLAVIGSVAADRGRKGYPAYSASKAAIETYLEGLRHRLHGTGVGVSTVKPGFVRTKMLVGGHGVVPAFPPSQEPDAAARSIVRGLDRGREVFYVPGWWRWIGLAMKLMPRFLFKRIAPA